MHASGAVPMPALHRLPFLGDVEAPLELEVLLLVVVNEAGDGVVVAAGEHAGWRLLLLDWQVVS